MANQEDLEPQVCKLLDSIHHLSHAFLKAKSNKDIIIPILEEVMTQTDAVGVTFMPFDDFYTPYAVVRESHVLNTQDLNTWVEYYAAPSIQSQCKICRKEHPVSEICPLLINPFARDVTVSCLQLKVDKHKLGVISLYRQCKNNVETETWNFLKIISTIGALALSSMKSRERIIPIEGDDNQPNIALNRGGNIQAEIQQKAISEERTRLAREIHDGLAQILGYAKLQLSMSLDQLESEELPQVKAMIQNSYQAIADAYIDAREAIDDLRQTPNREEFIPWLLETLAEFEENFFIKAEFTGWPDELIFPSLVHIHLTRMIQEILSNIRKHSRANLVQAIFTKHTKTSTLTFRDDGIGFSHHDPSDRSQHGLRILQERAELIDAKLIVYSEPANGTTVQIQLSNEKIGFVS